MEPIEFKNFAMFLDETVDDVQFDKEAIFRTAISRYYYYVFLQLRECIIQIDGRESVRSILNSHSAHRELREYLRKANLNAKRLGLDPKIYKIRNALKSLHNLRKTADYDMGELVDSNKVRDARNLIEDIENYESELKNVLSNLSNNGRLPRL
jgi:hypothetical protein